MSDPINSRFADLPADKFPFTVVMRNADTHAPLYVATMGEPGAFILPAFPGNPRIAVAVQFADGTVDSYDPPNDRCCRTYWGTHACMNDRGHDPVELPHRCMCCTHDTHTGFTDCVGGPPYYGPTTMFWGEDAPGANQ